jgi:hypothetical protein
LATDPEISVPVATVPKPFTENTLSIGSRKYPAAFFSPISAATCFNSRRSSSRPAPRRAYGYCRRAFQKRARHHLFHLQANQSENIVVHQVRLGQRDDAALDAEQPADVEMLARLRFDRFVGGHREQQ